MTAGLEPSQEARHDDGSIHIQQAPEPITIRRSNVYFAFGSGRFAYDCVTCGAKCCRGFTYKTTIGAELARQFDMRRALPLFVKPAPDRSSSQVVVGNYAPACFFLSDDGRCEIHATHGYDAKPETCRLFPFNNLRRLGHHLVVVPHPSLCPLGVLPHGSTSSCSRYDELFDAMASQGIHGHVPPCFVQGDPQGVIAHERAIVELSEQHLERGDYIDFVKAQLRAQQTHSPTADDADSVVEGMLTVFCELLGVPERDTLGADPDLVRCMVAVTPILRSRMVFTELSKVDGKPNVGLSKDRVPLALLSLYLLTEAAKLAGMKSVTYQTVSAIEQDFRFLAHVLSCYDLVMVIGAGAPLDPAGFQPSSLRMHFVRLCRALLPSHQERRATTLGSALLTNAPTDTALRSLFVKESSRHLAPVLVPANQQTQVRSKASVSARLGRGLHRMVLAHADDATLDKLYGRLSAKRRAGAGT